MVKSCPGYIPYLHKYNPEKMNERDLLLYEMMRKALYSTQGQKIAFEAEGY